jgi:hypothetical protein
MSVAVIKNRSRLLDSLLLYSPVLIAILIMLPRLVSPQFGLLDDGRGLVTLDKFVHHGIWDMSVDNLEGRYRPMYWLWFGLFYVLVGDYPFWFFFGNMLALMVAVAGLIYLVKKITGNRRAAWISGGLLALAGPVIESYYTLSKGETLQATLLVLSLVIISFYGLNRKLGRNIFLILSSAIFLLLAHTSKETSIVVLPIALVWYFVAKFLPLGKGEDDSRYTTRGAYVVSTFISVLVYYAMRIYFVTWQMNTGSYTSRYGFALDKILASSIRWAGWLIRDYAYLLPLVIIGLVGLVVWRKMDYTHLLLESLIWMAAWMLLLLPWYFMTEYYMMPFAIGAAVFGGILIENALCLVESEHKIWRWFTRLCLGLAVLLLVFSQLNNISNGRIQLAVDSANAEMLFFLRDAELSSTIFLNIQTPNEYYYKLLNYLNQYWERSDLSILPFDFQDTSRSGIYYLIVPYIVNQPLLAVRMGVVEETQNKWNDSLSQYFQEHLGWQKVEQIERRFTLSGVDLPRLFCPFIRTRAFCATPAPFVDVRPFVYGWTIYKLEKP